MKLFISWSGIRSKTVATALRQWLPDVIQFVEPWMSDADIEAGARWGRDIEKGLEETQFGIVCLTIENQLEPWILFEAGALAKTISETFVCPYLVGLEPSDIALGPLTQFQAKRANEKETWELVQTINRALKERALPEERLKRTFERAWPDLKAVLENLQFTQEIESPPRPLENLTNEILELVRGLSRTTPIESRVDSLVEDISYIRTGLTNLLANAQIESNPTKDTGSSRASKRGIYQQITISISYPVPYGGNDYKNLTINAQDTVFDTLSDILAILYRENSNCMPKQYTYLWDWIIIRTKDRIPLILKGVSGIVAAQAVFSDGEEWLVVALEEPLLNNPERFGLKRASSRNR